APDRVMNGALATLNRRRVRYFRAPVRTGGRPVAVRSCVMDAVIEWPVAERVRTVLARGASGTVEAGLLRRPLRSARVRDDGVVVLAVDAGGPGHDARGADTEAFPAGSSVSGEGVDPARTGRCRRTGGRPSLRVGAG